MNRQISLREALREALAEEMARDKNVICIGIDVRVGATGLTTGLVDKFGKERIVNTPIAESTVVGMGIGAAIMGLRPVSEIMFEDFALLAMDHIYNNMGTWHYLTNGQYKVPLTVITSSGTGAGIGSGHGHGQALQPLFMSSPGITICVPATPYDGKGLLKTAIRSDNPVLFSVDAICLGTVTGEVPEGDYTIPFGKARIVREGRDATVVALGKMVHHALNSAAELEKQGISVEVVDPRTIVPLDRAAILKSVAKTGRLVVAEESRIINGFGSEVLAIVASEDPSVLKAPARRVAAPMIPIPAAAILEHMYLPNKDHVSKAVKELVGRGKS
jgi:acetoin:2,6-dichlorophenolindophenol oxidoreductase subunit beta